MATPRRRALAALVSAPRSVRVEALRCLVLLVAVEIVLRLRLRPLPELAERLGVPLAAGRPLPPASPGQLPTWAWRNLRTVDLVLDVWPTDGMCLRRSLIGGHRVRSLGPELRIGVARRDGALVAHAWLELLGATIGAEDHLVLEDPRGRAPESTRPEDHP